MKIYLLGHKGPDLDATCGPIEYAEFLSKINRYPNAELIPAVCDGTNKETNYILEKFGVTAPVKISASHILKEDKIILIDHNEEDQRMDELLADQVIEVIDHHKIKVNFPKPIRVDVRPYGSVSSIVYENYVKEGVTPSEKISKLILSCILSDTQGLKSSTTTDWDVNAAENLAKQTGENIEKLTFEIFKAKSDITGLSEEEIIKKDYKIFEFSGKKVFIGQVETVEPEIVLAKKESILKTMEEVKMKEGVDFLFLVITDILKVNSQMLYITDEEKRICETAYNGVGEGNVINIGAKMSRKKDIAPEIEKTLSSRA